MGKKVRIGKFVMGKTLGEGTFGRVKEAVNTQTGERVAIKILDKDKITKQQMGLQVKKEISIMKMVRHENVATRVFLRCTSSILIEKHDATRQDAYT